MDQPAKSSNASWPQLVLGFVVAGAAACALGLILGYLTGQSGPDKTALLAALLPAVIAAGGLVVFSRLGSDGSFAANILPSVCVLVFAIGLYFGVEYGEERRKDGADRAAVIGLQLQHDLLKYRKDILQECSRQQFLLNQGRKELGLEPLSLNVVCGQLP